MLWIHFGGCNQIPNLVDTCREEALTVCQIEDKHLASLMLGPGLQPNYAADWTSRSMQLESTYEDPQPNESVRTGDMMMGHLA